MPETEPNQQERPARQGQAGERLSILHHAPSYFHERSIIGGGERYVLELARFQQLAGHDVRLVSYDRHPGSAPDQLEGVPLTALRSFHGLGFDRVNPFAWPSPRLVRRADVVHVHQLCTWVSDACALAAQPGRPALVGTDHVCGGFPVLN
ncbi:MAG: glycosyltransferase family 4 protein, partial [Opitutales bacterium]